ITTASFALGVALISRAHKFSINLEAALFGNILGVTIEQLLVLLGGLVFVGVVIVLRYRELLFATFDPEAADAYGISSRRTDTLLAIMVAAAIVAAVQALGVTLIAGTFVVSVWINEPSLSASPSESASSRPHRLHVRWTCCASSALWYSAPDSRCECCRTPTSSSRVSVR